MKDVDPRRTDCDLDLRSLSSSSPSSVLSAHDNAPFDEPPPLTAHRSPLSHPPAPLCSYSGFQSRTLIRPDEILLNRLLVISLSPALLRGSF
ncbi:hypothetical protein J6590_009135 [Homalodisca vitripennis]|nr:hypothetical protein J6590_009135 [Homalodisca vitripennis]